MKLTNSKKRPIQVFNRQGDEIHNVVSFNTKTCETEIHIPYAVMDAVSGEATLMTAHGKPVWKTVKTIIPGAIAVICQEKTSK